MRSRITLIKTEFWCEKRWTLSSPDSTANDAFAFRPCDASPPRQFVSSLPIHGHSPEE